MSHHCIIVTFYSSTEPSGTQVERDNPLYESQVTKLKVINKSSSAAISHTVNLLPVPSPPSSFPTSLPLPTPSFLPYFFPPSLSSLSPLFFLLPLSFLPPLFSFPPFLSQELTIEMFQDDDDEPPSGSQQRLVPPPPLTTSTPAGGRESTYSGADDDELLAEALGEPQKGPQDYNSETSLI